MTQKDQPSLPADAVSIPVAGKLLGLHPERIRQLIRSGHATSPARGYVNLLGLLRGYVAALRAEADKPASAAQARGYEAKAQLIEAATARRRADLVARADAEVALQIVADTARRHLRTLTSKRGAARGLPAAVQERVAQEVEVALGQIADAHQAAVAALRSGDFSKIEGGA